MDNGAEFYRRYRHGDDSGLAGLIRLHMDGLTLYLNGIVGDIYAAEDLTEDTFVKLATKKPRFSGKSSFKTWLYAIGRNLALDYLKKESRYADCGTESGLQRLRAEEDLEAAYIREDQRTEVRQMLRRLKPEYRQVLWLIYFDGLSCKEAAAVMQKSVHATQMLASRARQALKKELCGMEVPL